LIILGVDSLTRNVNLSEVQVKTFLDLSDLYVAYHHCYHHHVLSH